MSIAAWPDDVTPAVETLMVLGLPRIAAIRSAAVVYGEFTPTLRMETFATVRNRFQSLRRVFNDPRVSYAPRSGTAPQVQVSPSRAASKALLVPIAPDAPGWLMTTMVWP